MKLLYLLVCDQAFLSIDRKVNIIGVFETINAQNFPVTHQKFTLVGSIVATKGKFKLGVDIVSEKTNQSILLESQDREVNLPASDGSRNFNFIIDLINTSFPEAGNYLVNVSIDSKIIASFNLALAKIQDSTNFN